CRSGLTFQGKPMEFVLRDSNGSLIPKEQLYVPHWAKKCETCSFHILCSGCFNCGACEGWKDL
ncbi:MAG: hypothetical protein IKD66_04590, partial [Solobacterium sp.]|nr:hypothetical protein [Solobacterium sp.]